MLLAWAIAAAPPVAIPFLSPAIANDPALYMLPESPEKAPTIWLLVLLHAATAWLPPVLTATTNMVMPFLVTATMVVIPVCVVVRITVIPVTTAWFDCVMEFLMATVTIFMATVVKAPSVPSVAIVDRSDTASAVAEAAATVMPPANTTMDADVAIIGPASAVIAAVNGATAAAILVNAAAVGVATALIPAALALNAVIDAPVSYTHLTLPTKLEV